MDLLNRSGNSYETGLHNPVSSMSSQRVWPGATARKLLFVHGVRFAALIGIGGGSGTARKMLGNCFSSMGGQIRLIAKDRRGFRGRKGETVSIST